MPLTRTQLKNVYYRCFRCSVRRPLAEMVWQNGKLVCKGSDCVDKAVIGSRDLAVARAVAVDRKEGQPDPKLTHPGDPLRDLMHQ